MTSLARRLAALEKLTPARPPADIDEVRVLAALRAMAAGRKLGPRQQAAFDAWNDALARGHTYPAVLAGLSVDELRALIARWQREEN